MLLVVLAILAVVVLRGRSKEETLPYVTMPAVVEVTPSHAIEASSTPPPSASPEPSPVWTPFTVPTESPPDTPTSPPPTPEPSPTLIQVVGPYVGQVATVHIPVADIWREPKVGQDSERETQVLIGEQVLITDIRESWYRVVVLAQPSRKDDRGYPGWIQAEDVTLLPHEPEAIAIVMTPSALLRQAPSPAAPVVLQISLDTRLKLAAQDGDWLEVELPDGNRAWIERTQVRLEGVGFPAYTPSPENLVTTAKALLGIPYMWAGSSWASLDCSGVVYRTFHAHSILLARDSRDQAQGGRPVAREDLQPGDLVFYAVGGPSGTVSHVGLYIGDGLTIATFDGQTVRTRSYDDPTHQKELWGARRYW